MLLQAPRASFARALASPPLASNLSRRKARAGSTNTALRALRSTEERGHSASGHNQQVLPVPSPVSDEQAQLSQEEERQRSGSQASTSSAAAQDSSKPQQAALPSSYSQSSATSKPSWLAAARALVSSKHDAMIFNLALPSLLALAADPLLAITDTAFVGQLGANELAAFSINSSIFTFAFLIFNFLSTATTPAVATALATGDKRKAGETIKQALSLALVLGGGAAAILTLQATPALEVMGVEPSDELLFSLALQFLYIRATAAPAALLVSVSQGVFRGLQDMRTPLGVTVATNVLHLGLSLLFIFQLRMGLPGAALSISISEWAAAATYLALGWARRNELGLDGRWDRAAGGKALSNSSSSSSNGAGWEGSSTPIEPAMSSSKNGGSSSSSNGNGSNSNGIGPEAGPRDADAANNDRGSGSSSSMAGGRPVAGLGGGSSLKPAATATAVTGCSPAGAALRTFAASYAPFLQAGGAVLLRTGLLLGTKTLASAVAMRLGPEQMSTHQILYQVWLVASLAVDSLAISGQVAVAVNLGKGDLNAAREVSDRLLQLGVGLGGTLALVLLIADPVWPRTFTQEDEVIAAVQALSPLALALLPINSVVYVLDGVFVGANDFVYLVKAMLVAAMLGTPLLLAVQPMDLGLEGVWWGLSALMIGRCLGLLYRYNSPDGPVPPLALAARNSDTDVKEGVNDNNGNNGSN